MLIAVALMSHTGALFGAVVQCQLNDQEPPEDPNNIYLDSIISGVFTENGVPIRRTVSYGQQENGSLYVKVVENGEIVSEGNQWGGVEFAGSTDEFLEWAKSYTNFRTDIIIPEPGAMMLITGVVLLGVLGAGRTLRLSAASRQGRTELEQRGS